MWQIVPQTNLSLLGTISTNWSYFVEVLSCPHKGPLNATWFLALLFSFSSFPLRFYHWTAIAVQMWFLHWLQPKPSSNLNSLEVPRFDESHLEMIATDLWSLHEAGQSWMNLCQSDQQKSCATKKFMLTASKGGSF